MQSQVNIRLPFDNDSFPTVYADPPWPEGGGGKIKRGADAHYPLMKIKDIQGVDRTPTKRGKGVLRFSKIVGGLWLPANPREATEDGWLRNR